MKRILALLLATTLVAQPVAAQAGDRRHHDDGLRTALALGVVGIGAALLLNQNRAREGRYEPVASPRVDLREVVRRLQGSRPGQMLGARESGDGDRVVYVIRWRYPDGRVADIIVDARTGSVIGEN